MSAEASSTSAAAILGGSALEAGAGLFSSAFNVSESRKNRRFQRDMSNTAHQREVEDLRKAGINPLLSARLGGASTPQGATANVENPLKGLTQNVLQSKVNTAQVANLEAQTQKTLTEKKLLEQDLGQKDKTNPKYLEQLMAQIDVSKATSALQRKQVEEANARIKNLSAELLRIQTTGKLVDEVGNILPGPQKIINEIENLKAEFKWLYHSAKNAFIDKPKPKPRSGATGGY